VNLLDTHVLVWAVHEPNRLSPTAHRMIEQSDYYVSAASLWELVLKKGRVNEIVADPVDWWHRYVVATGTRILSMGWREIAHLDILPLHTKDPFDRILVCQAVLHGLRFITKDAAVRDHYQGIVNCVW
jgi:PIN domain nuclease of toxin-antitoxin system